MATLLWRRLGEQFFDSNGDPLAGGKLKYERAGTSTLLDTWSNAAGTIPNTQTANRIILDSAGRLTEAVYLDDTFDAKETLYTSADVIVSPWPFDDIPKAVDLLASLSDFAKPKIELSTDTAATVNLTTADIGKGRLASTGSNSITYNAPSASEAGNGRGILIKKTSASNTVTFEPDGSETVDGAANFSWTANNRAYWFIPDGANWRIEAAYLANLTAADVTAVATTSVAGFVQLADQAAQEAATSGRAVTSDVQHFNQSAAKFWVYAGVSAGVPQLSKSYNVTSVTDTGAGAMTVVIANDYSDALWPGVVTAEHETLNRFPQGSTKAAGSWLVLAKDAGGTNSDPIAWNVIGFGDL